MIDGDSPGQPDPGWGHVTQWGVRFIHCRPLIAALYLLLGVASPFYKRFLHGDYSNYLIFKNAFLHLADESNLYALYPEGGLNYFLYGPLFSFLMAPCAMLPDSLGCLLFLTASTCLLFTAFQMLPTSSVGKNAACLLCLIEFGNNQQHFQFNAIIAALIMFSFIGIIRKREATAAACIALGALTKLFGVIALPFFFFTERKCRFILGLIAFFAIGLILPTLVASPAFVIESYQAWPEALSLRHEVNMGLETFQDKSLGDMVRRLTGKPDLVHWPFLVIGGALFWLPFLFFKQGYTKEFRLLLLSSALMFILLFSSSSENPTYLIAVRYCHLVCWGKSEVGPVSRFAHDHSHPVFLPVAYGCVSGSHSGLLQPVRPASDSLPDCLAGHHLRDG